MAIWAESGRRARRPIGGGGEGVLAQGEREAWLIDRDRGHTGQVPDYPVIGASGQNGACQHTGAAP